MRASASPGGRAARRQLFPGGHGGLRLGVEVDLSSYVIVSSPQCGENPAFSFGFPLGGIHSQGILLVIP